MAKTVDEGFREFLSRLTPTGTESQKAKSHRASIQQCLKDSFGMTAFFRTGSFGNGTSIRGFSDVDYFAEIPAKNLIQDSSVTLRRVREALEARFPNTGVVVATPAVLVPFGTEKSEWTEVVPADLIRTTNKDYRVYEIADGTGGWMTSSPDAHNAYVREVDIRHGGKVKPLVRFLKAWKFFRNVPILSFYLELRAAKYAADEEAIVYESDVTRMLRLLSEQKLAAMRDPQEVSGSVKPCSTEAKHEDALSKLETALSRAEKALEASGLGKDEDAFYWWNLLYDGNFPAR